MSKAPEGTSGNRAMTERTWPGGPSRQTASFASAASSAHARPGEQTPQDALAERQVSTRQAWRGRFLDVRQDEVRLPDGTHTSREYVVHPGAVMIIPLLSPTRAVMERQFRYPMGRAMIEFPAGKLDPGESNLACAVRELAEETGYRARRWARAGVMHPVISYSTEFIEVWFADDLQAGESQLDQEEFLEVFSADLSQLDAWARDGQLTDAKTLVGMLWWHQWREGRWALSWQDAPGV